MNLKIANAPVSWGVDYADDPKNPLWQKVMDEIKVAGYGYTELGPYGYYPTEPARLAKEFVSRDLTVTAGFIFENLHDRALADAVLAKAERTASLVAAVGGKYLVLIDHISPERMATAGRSDLSKRLDAARFNDMVDLIRRIAQTTLQKGVLPVVHQHAGCYIEYEDEIEALLAATDPAVLGVCIDTGHMAYAGIDPVAFYRRHASRVKYFHFKDIDRATHRRVLIEKIEFLEAVKQNVFCRLGRGVVNFPDLAVALRETNFQGYANVEQDIDPTVSFNAIDDARKSLAFLASAGF